MSVLPDTRPADRWPELHHYQFIGGLDWAVLQFDEKWLLDLAEILENNGELGPVLRRSVIEFLQLLARTPSALKALNHHRQQTPRSVLGLNRALHYVVLHKLAGGGRGTGKAALLDVASRWEQNVTSIKGDMTEFGAEARSHLKRLVARCLLNPLYGTEHDVLAKLDKDLTHRAKLMRRPRGRKKLA